MWKKIIIVLLIVILGGFYYFHYQSQRNLPGNGSLFPQKNITPTAKPLVKTSSVFVPSWSQMDIGSRDEYDRYIYFGVNVNEKGIITTDDGYKNLDRFTAFSQGKEKWLTVRMLDHDANTTILEDSSTWLGIAHDVAQVAKDNGYDGVVLDLEVGLVAFHISPDSISGFTETLSHQVHQSNMKMAMAIYGDTSFRKRPYDVKTLQGNVDEIMIMAYDFHKSFGEAGPNFPLNGVDKYDYDFTTMLSDFTSVVPADKISIVYGMYGYEWIVDDQDRSVKPAAALTLNQINQRFMNGCKEKSCTIKRDDESAETEIRFKDDEGKQHEVWFEDMDSATKKQQAAENLGIGGTVYWAYGYF